MDPALHRITERIRAATADSAQLRIRGGGSKDFYGDSRQGDLLDTSELAGITSYESTELVVTVRAGTLLAELEAVLAEKGQCLPFEPPHFSHSATPANASGAHAKVAAPHAAPIADGHSPAGRPALAPGTATVGGMVAAGLSGPARASVGAVRDYVLGATLINGRAQALTFGGQVMKNVAGYDVSRVLAGSMGTLGVITEVSLKVLPVAPAEATLKFECSQIDALRLLNEWGGRPLPLNASCWAEDGGVGTLFVRLRGAVAAVQAACAQLGGERQDNAQVAPDWQACRDQRLPWFSECGARDLWRLSVPQTAPVLALQETPLIEWHGGQRWYLAPPGQARAMRAAAHGVGGHATLFMAAPDCTTGVTSHFDENPVSRFDALSAPLERIHRALQREFDPAGIFNRGRLLAA